MSEINGTSMRDRILQEATRLLVRSGYDGIAMREIADACGISKAGLYYHFTDKEALFLAILDQSLDTLGGIIHEAAQQAGGAREQLAFFVRAIFTHLSSDQRTLIRLAGQEMGKLTPTVREQFAQRYYNEFVGGLAGMIEQGIRAGTFRPAHPQTAAWVLLGMMYPFFSQGSEPRTEPGGGVVEFILAVFIRGMQPDR
ncbi:MAG TPA: TetR/AcrR family transcriptional regulator [Anaerolinea sp.]|nr:TetR/AcrR family transcriptional regulator [Anaerolinea sp.]